ncbi:hypothetical protein ELQ87_35155 [Streptomyces griseoviridis]|uniref:PE-PGRS family protein n=1 Tax=Streptomyces griseoviridis TaxID=45398 RepID=A0A3S9ZMB0_STRGD|nr:hypothetical protein [Streptomyces griseoviridis]AZS88894.1 hypothetical protein ELQ87_35155 [Streptomyces griseoviridis]QCN84261.1 hypothetical protein DDJ31_04095 [Streptomyces griseoviridis]
MTVRGWCRTVRAGVFAAVCVVLAALGHATMSGASVPWWAMAAGAAATGAAGWLLAGRERGRAVIVAVVTAAQAVLHETFSLAQTLTPARGAGSTSMHATLTHSTPTHSMDMHSMEMPMPSMGGMDMGAGAHAVGGMAGLHQAHGMSGAASVGMFAAHLVAAVLCGLWLAHGERAVFQVLRATAAWLAAPLRLLVALPAPADRPSAHRRRAPAADAPVRLLLVSSLTFRGPPAGAAVV